MEEKDSIVKYCEKTLQILNLYYNFQSIPDVKNFILAPQANGQYEGQILFEEREEEVYIGIQFAQEIHENMKENNSVSAHQMCVIAEELSHFQFISDVVTQGKKTTLLTLETLGEIDRFLCIMHWNHFAGNNAKINLDLKNIHEICDYVFTGDRFQTENKKLYIEAENLAFKHLKEAFSDKWDYSYYNFSSISKPAKIYLHTLRNQFLA